jgi:geranylgeranyl diphosphate synthase type I
LYPAAGLEILHNYSLIIDDIIDNSVLRRGKATTWFKYGRSIAECVGMDYSSAIFQAANRSKNPLKISELFAKTMTSAILEVVNALPPLTCRVSW